MTSFVLHPSTPHTAFLVSSSEGGEMCPLQHQGHQFRFCHQHFNASLLSIPQDGGDFLTENPIHPSSAMRQTFNIAKKYMIVKYKQLFAQTK